MGEFILGILGRILFALLLLPICLVIGTPIILVVSMFGKGPYGANVRAGYRVVFEMWGDIGTHIF